MRTLVPGVALFLAAVVASAQQPATEERKQTTQETATIKHVIMTDKDLKWGDPPAGLPEGAQVAVLSGDPTKEGTYTIRVMMPAGYRVAPHWHGADEHVTVIEGEFQIGMGSKVDPRKVQAIGPGGFVMMPKGMQHFAQTEEGTTIQLHGIGPWTIHYVDPADDPRRKRAAVEERPTR